jgi:plasmid stabilization system protein ParE
VIRLSRAARAQVSQLTRYYADHDRPEAVRNLRGALARAAERIEARRGPFLPTPRPYPSVARPGWQWLKQGSYWIGFASDMRGPIIRAVFHEAADIPNRM